MIYTTFTMGNDEAMNSELGMKTSSVKIAIVL